MGIATEPIHTFYKLFTDKLEIDRVVELGNNAKWSSIAIRQIITDRLDYYRTVE